MSTLTKNSIDFSLKNKVKDMSLAEWGRKEIKLAEAEMPGLMSLRHEFGKDKAFERCKNCRLPSHDDTDCCAY